MVRVIRGRSRGCRSDGESEELAAVLFGSDTLDQFIGRHGRGEGGSDAVVDRFASFDVGEQCLPGTRRPFIEPAASVHAIAGDSWAWGLVDRVTDCVASVSFSAGSVTQPHSVSHGPSGRWRSRAAAARWSSLVKVTSSASCCCEAEILSATSWRS